MKTSRLTRLARGVILLSMLTGFGYILCRSLGLYDSSSSALLPVTPVGSVQTASEQISSVGSFVSVAVVLICLGLGLVFGRFKSNP